MKLSDLTYLVVDCQTTATHPNHGHLLELGWGVATLKEDLKASSSLIELPDGETIPARVREMTGISDEEMAKAREPEDVLQEFSQALRSAQVGLAHYSSFEKTFLEATFLKYQSDRPWELPLICTQKLTKILYPRMTSYNLRAVAGFFGPSLHLDNRALSHVEATWSIWKGLIAQAEKQGILTLDDLMSFTKVQKIKKVKTESYQYRFDREKRLALPDEPGIYKMLSREGKILYVGKATSLRSRVNSYFRGINNRDRRKLEMIAQVWDIHVTPCGSPLQAALLESDEIKRLLPRYNVALRGSDRPILFYNREFSQSSTAPSVEFSRGPFRAMERLEQLREFWASFSQGDLGQPFFDFVEPELIADGWKAFVDRHPVNLEAWQSFRDALAFGCSLSRRLKRMTNLPETPDDEAGDQLDCEGLTPSEVADKFERMFVGAAQNLVRAKKLLRLVSARIYITEASGRLFTLCTRDGVLVSEDEWQQSGTQPRLLKPMTSAVYDRISILLTGIQSYTPTCVKMESLRPVFSVSRRELKSGETTPAL